MQKLFAAIATLCLFYATLGFPSTARAQIPAIPGLTTAAASKSETAASAETNPQADREALQRVIGLLSDDTRRAALLNELRSVEGALGTNSSGTADAGKATGAPAEAPAKDEAAPIIGEKGLIGAISSSLAESGQGMEATSLGAPVEEKLGRAVDELQARIDSSLGGQATIDFLQWALPGAAVVIGLVLILFRNNWLRRHRELQQRPGGTAFQIARAIAKCVPFGLIPLFVVVATASGWAAAFAPSWQDGRLFLALFSPLFAALATRQILYYLLMALGPSRGWRLVGYAQRRLLGWVGLLAALAATAGVLREFSLRVVVGFDVADVASLLIDLGLAVLTAAFIMRHRLTVRSLLIRGHRDREGQDHSSGIFSSAFHALAASWHLVALAFVVANVVARLTGTGNGQFILESSGALLYIFGGLALLAVANAGFKRMADSMGRGRVTLRSAIMLRYLDIFHLLFQIAVAAFVLVQAVDVWGFDLAGWLGSERGQRFLRPALSLILVPAVIYAIWTTIDTAVTHSLQPTDSRGRTRNRSGRIRTLLPLLRNLVFVVLSVVTVIAMLANIGVDVTPLLAGAGVIGLAFSFGAQQLVQDVITGFFIIFEDTIAVGDVISTGDRTGTVEGLTIRTVRIRDGNGALHSVPFSQIKALQNNSRGFGIFPLNVSIAFGADVDRTMEIMQEVGRDLLTDATYGDMMLAPIEMWGVDGFTREGVVIKGAIRCKPLQQWGVGREFNRRLKRRLDDEHIRFFAAEQRIAVHDDQSLRVVAN
ncbi:mechanosensitive ion channel domain-containing protein [Aureimonas sp. D3]|uniref:mechanosensitive ion channel domain-containing protein n=1 Tax=Aureimonas sp. D3 TaxID=1638164 RepID=UPI0007851DF1|nr:mechanosensitive ion channel domain-containing protein [Aureimonas sp. D3]